MTVHVLGRNGAVGLLSGGAIRSDHRFELELISG
jgi:hypothetical protein